MDRGRHPEPDGCAVAGSARRSRTRSARPTPCSPYRSRFNSLNKWAGGFADTVAVGVLCALLGAGVPIVAAPCVKSALRRHPAYRESIERLARAGVRFVDPDAVTHRGSDGLAAFDWPTIIDELGAHESPCRGAPV
ncbi:MAG: flavoprotein [Thermocrispum agreste]|uniref:Flavoprotein n=1 Tax=Thermocrispum agreste TaxID=37925 RepID=A0ABD6FID3_9PSEU